MLAICATITPFTAEGDLDVAGLRPLFEAVRESGFEYAFVAGTTGEFTALDDDERLTVLTAALEVFGPDGVFGHVGAATTRQTVRLARAARQAGLRRLAAVTPYYLPAGPEATVEHYRALTEAVPDAEWYAYVFPQRAVTDVDPATLARLAALPGMAGAKLSGRTTAEVLPYLDAVASVDGGGFAIFSGADRELPELARTSCAGIVSGVGGVFPDPFIRGAAGPVEGTELSALQAEIDTAVDLLGAGDLRLVKAGVAARGLPAGPVRVSVDPPSAAALEALRIAVASGTAPTEASWG
jgi:4-hydroxy-tetrahydrodipicolinate synthase